LNESPDSTAGNRGDARRGTLVDSAAAFSQGATGRSVRARQLTVSVIVCTKDREEEVETLMRSLCRQHRLPDELIIVDGGAPTELERRVTAAVGGLMPLVYLHTAPGLPRQRNRGITASHGDVVLFLDDDVVLAEDYMQEIVGFLENDATESFAAVQGAVVDCPNRGADRPIEMRGWRRSVGGAIKDTFMLWSMGDGRIKRSGFPARAQGEQPSRTEFMSGCSMCMRRGVFDEARFDERLTGYAFMEDVDICRQMLRLGHSAAYWPRARLEHHYTTSSRTPAARLGRMMIHNHHYLHCKHTRGSATEHLAFWWSSIGLIVYAAAKGDWPMAQGVLNGLADVIRQENPLIGETPDDEKPVRRRDRIRRQQSER
jgi:glucosyl-dolichyl phosphate glucuronosyltransferase